ncbi:type IV secretion system protein [Sphingosinicellaceae bacterium]|nr:type IV secretion system protein [Sphingosinicellaceae bacterium]
MSACPGLANSDSAAGIAQALRAIDCRTGEATAYAFGRLFGADGRLMPVLTGCLTLFVAFFAISLLTGRSRLGISALTPRMLTLGLVLTFATSWVAYQQVVWTLASGAPDQIAGLLAGSHGSATVAFADRLDQLFAGVADAATQAGKPGATTDTGITPAAATVGGFSSATALWVCAILLMLGTAGVLLTSKIALAALLAIGPLFIVLALFRSSRGLFVGWLKAVVMFALVPLFAVLIGGAAVGALSPLVGNIAAAGGQPQARDVAVLFLGVCVYCALMLMVLKTASTIIAGWRISGGSDCRDGVVTTGNASALPSVTPVVSGTRAAVSANGGDDRVRRIVASIPVSIASDPANAPGSFGRGRTISAQIVSIGGDAARPARTADRRIQSVGSRFRAAPAALSKEHVS